MTLTLSPEIQVQLEAVAARRGLPLEDTLAAVLAEAFQQEAPDTVLARYARRELTHGEAARLLGLSRAALLEELARRNLSPFQYDAAEVLAEAGL